MPTTVPVGLVQTYCTADVADNRARTLAGIREAAAKGAKIVSTQELFCSLYFCDVEAYGNFALAEPIPDGPSVRELQALAAELGIVIVASLFERRAQGVYHNTAAVIDAGGEFLGIYRKQHIPDDPGYYEKFYFTPGDQGYKVFRTRYAAIGVLVCWDQWYPEAARITSLMGAEILFYPTAIGWAVGQTPEVNDEQYQAWQTIQRSHAIANGVHVVSVNRIGREGDMQFWGGSFVSNPFGKVLFQASHEAETVHVQELDLQASDFYRTHWPFLRDRRIDTYEPILKRFID
ncbi:MAG: carbon-nitrogen hydrolase [Bacteroidia bacterium]|nr:carbon-nitrogen hydrolase [Bacteroidia bacterium]